MKERPILFSGSMIRAILNGSKVQTRRVVKQRFAGTGDIEPSGKYAGEWFQWDEGQRLPSFTCPYGVAGDRLYVKETWRPVTDVVNELGLPQSVRVKYSADGLEMWRAVPVPVRACANKLVATRVDQSIERWVSSMFMPRWASRITLEVVSVRVERLAQITLSDVIAEGIPAQEHPSDAIGLYAELWDKINGKRPGCAWDDNCYVWCIEFKKL